VPIKTHCGFVFVFSCPVHDDYWQRRKGASSASGPYHLFHKCHLYGGRLVCRWEIRMRVLVLGTKREATDLVRTRYQTRLSERPHCLLMETT
jgi:hypothetical protein